MSFSLTNAARLLALTLLLPLLVACSTAPYRHDVFVPSLHEDRIKTKQEGGFTVRAFVPGAEQSQQLFGVDLYKRGIQPVWLEISNHEPDEARFTPYSVDHDYFSPLEVAYIHRKQFSKQGWMDMEEYLHENSIPRTIPAGETVSGFMFTQLRDGTKAFNVDLFRAYEHERFSFFVQVPGFTPDHAGVDFKHLFDKEDFRDVDLRGLDDYLNELACCSTDYTGEGLGKPLNIIVISKGETLLEALLRAGWDETAYVRDEAYLTSADYFYGRPPDAIFRKKRGKTTERNELNVWMTPIRIEDTPVWVAQIKHAIGRRFKIEEIFLGARMDPDVDDGRNYLMQNFWYAQTLAAFARSESGKPVPRETPELNFRNNPFFTDGDRFLLWLSSEPVALDETMHVMLEEGQ